MESWDVVRRPTILERWTIVQYAWKGFVMALSRGTLAHQANGKTTLASPDGKVVGWFHSLPTPGEK